MQHRDTQRLHRAADRNAAGAVVNALTFNGCEDAGEPVDVETVKNGTLDIEIIDLPVWTHNGTLTLTGTEIRVLWTWTGAECFYDAAHAGVLTGGPMATIDWSVPDLDKRKPSLSRRERRLERRLHSHKPGTALGLDVIHT